MTRGNLSAGLPTAALTKMMLEVQKGAFADATKAAIARSWRLFLSFLQLHYPILPPADSYCLRLFMTFLSNQPRINSPDTIEQYISHVKTAHRLLGYPVDAFQQPEIRYFKRAIGKHLAYTRREAAPMTTELLHQIRSLLDLDDRRDATTWACLLISFFAITRIDNLLPTTKNPSSSSHHLTRGRAFLGRSNLILAWKWAKTITQGERIHRVPLSALPNSLLCPVAAYSRMVNLIPALPQDPAFLVPDAGGNSLSPLTYSQHNTRLKHLVEACEVNPSNFSTHSLRRGGATTAIMAGVPLATVKAIGDWAKESTCVSRYINPSLTDRAGCTALMAGREPPLP